jgi:hypothetical protein
MMAVGILLPGLLRCRESVAVYLRLHSNYEAIGTGSSHNFLAWIYLIMDFCARYEY